MGMTPMETLLLTHMLNSRTPMLTMIKTSNSPLSPSSSNSSSNSNKNNSR
jgi:hypothetical protein